MLVDQVYIFFSEVSRSFALFFFLVGLFVFLILSVTSSLYFLDIGPLSAICMVNIVSHSFSLLNSLLTSRSV